MLDPSPTALDADRVAAVREAHRLVCQAEDRLDRARPWSAGPARAELVAARARQQVLLHELGFGRYADFVLWANGRKVTPSAPAAHRPRSDQRRPASLDRFRPCPTT